MTYNFETDSRKCYRLYGKTTNETIGEIISSRKYTVPELIEKMGITKDEDGYVIVCGTERKTKFDDLEIEEVSRGWYDRILSNIYNRPGGDEKC